jgi:hypothetical protein
MQLCTIPHAGFEMLFRHYEQAMIQKEFLIIPVSRGVDKYGI